MHPRPLPRADFERIEDIMADALAMGRIAARRLGEVSLRGERLPDGGWLARQLTGPGVLELTVHEALEDVVRALREREDAGWTLVPVGGDPARHDSGLTPEAQNAAHARRDRGDAATRPAHRRPPCRRGARRRPARRAPARRAAARGQTPPLTRHAAQPLRTSR